MLNELTYYEVLSELQFWNAVYGCGGGDLGTCSGCSFFDWWYQDGKGGCRCQLSGKGGELNVVGEFSELHGSGSTDRSERKRESLGSREGAHV